MSIINDIKKGFDSFTGKTARKNAANNKDRINKSIRKPAKEFREEAKRKREAAEAKSREVTPATSERINRKDIRDIEADQVEAAKVKNAYINQDPQSEFRVSQSGLAQRLATRARGEGLSPAQMQLQQATERNIAQQAAARAGLSGSRAALGRREAGRIGAALAQQGAQQGAILRSQEQQAAEQQLGQVLTNARGQDIGLAAEQAKLEQQAFSQGSAQEQQAILANQEAKLKAQLANQGTDLDVLKDNARRGDAVSMANLEAQLRKIGMNDAMIQAYMRQELGALGIEAGMASQELAGNREDRAAKNSTVGALIGAGATIGASAVKASDINLKKDIKKSKRSIGEFLSSLDPYDYKYKDEKHGKGRQTSVMAQDLEKSEIGKKAIIETGEGKMVDYAKLLPAMLAANVDANKRIMSLEEALKLKKKGKK